MDKPLTVVLFSNLYPPAVSGSSIQTHALAKALTAHGCSVVVITAQLDRGSKYFEEEENVHIYRLPSIHLPQSGIALNFPWLNITYTPGNQQRIEKILDNYYPDIIHLQNHMFDLGFSAVRAASKYRIPLIITIHTIIKHPNPLYNGLLYPIDRIFLKQTIINKANILICPDITIQEYVLDAFNKTNIALIPYGIQIPPQQNSEEIAKVKAKYQLRGSPILLSLGHLHEIRNRKDLIEAMPLILAKYPTALLVIAGAIGTDSARALAQRLGVQKSIIFTGAVPHNESVSLLQIADIEAHWFQVNNPQTRTLGLAALEAMGAGKVVINTADEDVYGKDVLRDQINYIHIKPDQPEQVAKIIIKLLEDNSKRESIGAEAKKTILENFSWDMVCSKMISLYKDTIEGQRENTHI